MKRLLLVLLVVPLVSAGKCWPDNSGEIAALEARLDTVYNQVVEITNWAREGIPDQNVRSVNSLLEAMSDIDVTYAQVCEWAASQGQVNPADCPPPGEPTTPPGEKPPRFPPQ